MNSETLTQVLISDLDRENRLTDFSLNHDSCPEKLMDSVKEIGIRHPISICSEIKPYKIISGHKRVQAAIKAGLTHIPAFLFPDMKDALVLNLKENFSRIIKLEKEPLMLNLPRNFLPKPLPSTRNQNDAITSF